MSVAEGAMTNWSDQITGPGPGGLGLVAAPGLLPDGGRRAGLLAHDYRPRLEGLTTRYLTGWLEREAPGRATYAPHTDRGYAAPPNKTLMLLLNGAVTKYGVRKAIRSGRLTELPTPLRPRTPSPSA